MKRWMGLCLAGRMLTVGAAASMVAGSAGVAGCLTVEDVTKNFFTVYPTGGHAARFDGARGEHVMRGLAIGGDGDEVVFLYSGDGPTTGARGRYMYLILDAADCILERNWVDGETYDRVSPAD